jgi:hypothetical protein
MSSGQLVATEIKEKLPRDVENCIQVIQFEIKRKQKDMAVVMAKTEPSENERVKVGRELEFISNIERLIKAFRNTFHANLGKIPPCDIDLERDILGALMLERYGIDQVQSYLMPDHFYTEAHNLIYTAILALYRNGAPVDMITVKNYLRKAGHLELVGGARYLAQCTAGVSSAASIDYWCRVVVEFAIKRHCILAGSEACRNSYDDISDGFEILETLDERVKEAQGWIKQ